MNLVGRDEELALLDTTMRRENESSAARVAVLVGAGGVGKTALALHWSHHAKPLVPDGQLYADLAGEFEDRDSLDPRDVVHHFLQALGVAAQRIPTRFADQVALYRSVTSGRRLLILLDNALSTAQVRPLLPATPNSLVLVTTRWRPASLVADGAALLEVTPLDAGAATTMLSNTVGSGRAAAEPGPVNDLVGLCGGLPIALRLAGARLATHPRWTVARVVGDLRDEQHRLSRLTVPDATSVTATFDLSLAALPPDVARIYRLLGLHPGRTFTVDAVAELVGTCHGEAADMVETLVDASLLEETGTGRFGFHDLIRLHARHHAEELEQSDRTAATDRLVHWYLHRAIAADRTLMPLRWRVAEPDADSTDSTDSTGPTGPTGPTARGFGGREDALEWFSSEYTNLLAIVRLAADRGLHGAVWRFCEALWSYFLHARPYAGWIASHELGVEAAEACGDAVAESRIRYQLGYVHLSLEDYPSARVQFGAALVAAERADHRISQATALEHLGKAASGTGDFVEAEAFLVRALTIDREVGRRRAEALHLRALGEVQRRGGAADRAVVNLGRAREIAAGIGDDHEAARATACLGEALSDLGRHAEATELLEESLLVMRRLKSRFHEAGVLAALGCAAQRAGNRTLARTHFSQAASIYEQIEGPQVTDMRDRLSALDAEPDRAE